MKKTSNIVTDSANEFLDMLAKRSAAQPVSAKKQLNKSSAPKSASVYKLEPKTPQKSASIAANSHSLNNNSNAVTRYSVTTHKTQP